MRLLFAALGVICLFVGAAALFRIERVGPQADGWWMLPTGHKIRAAGKMTQFNGRPVDLVFVPQSNELLVKDNAALRVFDGTTLSQKQEIKSPGGASLTGLEVTSDGERAYFTNAEKGMHEFVRETGGWALKRTIELAATGGRKNSFPCGLAIASDDKTAYVALSLNNSVGVVDLGSATLLKLIDVGIAPYGVELARSGRELWVSCQGGAKPSARAQTAPSAGTPVEVDRRGIVKGSTISIVDLAKDSETSSIPCGLQPTDVIALGSNGPIAVACANADVVEIFDLISRKRIASVDVKPSQKLTFGSMPNALGWDKGRKRLFAACAGNNALAVIDVTNSSRPKVTGFIPTGWYPAAVKPYGDAIFVGDNKGYGDRAPMREAAKGHNSHDRYGGIEKIAWPDAGTLRTLTAQVWSSARVPQILSAYERTIRRGTKPVPVPRRLGEPSVFQHVIYVIKENRTYDQVFGDIERGERDKRLCVFGEEITPNHHALANTFVLLDNYYCNGVLSADGHSWATEGNVTPYLNRAFGGFNRSYTFGDDPLTYSASGFIWDRVLAAGLSFRNYGEMDDASLPNGMTGQQLWEKYKKGERVEFKQRLEIDNLRRYSCREYPGWNMQIPDQLRIDAFLQEFAEFERNGDLPNFITIYLPQDHCGGWVTPRANVADNDLAIGRLIETVSKSRFWKNTVVFINEDDPQNGFDHVDGHRSICLVVSPYTKRGALVSDFCNQTSVLHTMLRILGLPPMNQQDAQAPLMSSCFTSTPDFTPYTARPNRIALDETKDAATKTGTEAAKWAAAVAKIDLTEREVQTHADMDALNRYVWHSVRGDAPYPSAWAGAHARGLARRGLKLGGDADEDD